MMCICKNDWCIENNNCFCHKYLLKQLACAKVTHDSEHLQKSSRENDLVLVTFIIVNTKRITDKMK